MTGFRIGWCVAPRRLVEVMTNVQAQTTSCASPVMQAGAEGALLGLQSVVEGLRLSIQNNRDIVMRELSSFNGVKTYRPDGTFYVLPDFRAYNTQLGGAVEVPAEEGAGRDGARDGNSAWKGTCG